MRLLSLTTIFALACAFAAGCDYPEAGFYEIAAVKPSGKVVASFPFMIEELVDDTDLTTGFNILLPRDGELVTVSMANSTDLSRRSWDIKMADSDSRLGDLQLTLAHENEQLSYSALYRPRGASQSEMFSGKDIVEISGDVSPGNEEHPGTLNFSTPLPARIAEQVGDARWEIRWIPQQQFESVLGGPVAKAPRRDATYLATIKHDAPDSPDPHTAKRQKPKTKFGTGRQAGP